jgi:8-amino-7-oxononanoate synthase
VTRGSLDRDARAEVDRLARLGLARAPTGAGAGLDLVTNDYLGLRDDPRVLAAARAALERRGLGAGAARLLGGDHPEHRALEAAFARAHGEEAAVLFPSGSAANQGVLGALLRPGDLAVCDARNHGSLVDGVRLSRARRAIVPHGDVLAVEDALRKDAGGGRRFVVLEGVHGMEGDVAPLADLADVCRRLDALLVVDEAHAAGVVGPDGAGAAALAGVEDVVAARVVPLGKAFGGAGGVVTASAAVCDEVVHRARAYLFATALPPAVAAGVAEAHRLARAEPERRARATALARRLAGVLEEAGARVAGRGAAVVSWILGSAAAALDAAAALRARGVEARAVRPPTVPEGEARVRLSCHASPSDAEVERAAEALREAATRAAAVPARG